MNARWVLPIALITVLAAAGIALFLGGGGSPGASASASPSIGQVSASPTDASTFSPDPSGAPSAPAAGDPAIDGPSLPVLVDPETDPAVGQVAPRVSGSSFDGSAVTIGMPGRPQVVIFLAHWCPHCQREVPVIQAWLDANGPPDGVDLRSVATAIDPTLPNYPPDVWLTTERWSVPVLVDPTDTVASAYGLSAFPFFVFLDAQGRVALRATGELSIETIEQILGVLRAAS